MSTEETFQRQLSEMTNAIMRIRRNFRESVLREFVAGPAVVMEQVTSYHYPEQPLDQANWPRETWGVVLSDDTVCWFIENTFWRWGGIVRDQEGARYL